jgi:predicted RNA-binding protein YlqC (UPF0109 family)
MVTDFLLVYTKLLVNYPEDVLIECAEINAGFDEITIFANSEDVGKLIGKEGKMINAIKTVISGCKAKGGKSYRINIKTAK